MIELLVLSIGVGLAVSLLFSESFGYAPGGLVVPGYFALFLTEPAHILLTLLAAAVTFVIVRGIGTVLIVYGRRRTVLMILVGYLAGILLPGLLTGAGPADGGELTVIGYIIPGLIAIWMDRQGPVETVSALVIVSVLVRMVLVLMVGDRMFIA